MTSENIAAMDRLEAFVRERHFPQSRFYRIEWMEDAYRCVWYKVYISSLETPCWEAYGEGSHLDLAIEAAFKKIPVDALK
jgi:hypothetical protein